ncbi:MAG: hypothetical protein WCX17_02910 [Parcubacteria group bacterium]|jgi:uncharacterized membrane protein
MNKNKALKTILAISILGMLFSGYLSYGKLFQATCPLGGGCTSVLGAPACVYGFIMYLIVFCISLAGVKAKE